MKRHSSAASLALAVLAVLGLTGPVAAGERVPFKGSFEGVAIVTPAPTTPGFARSVSAAVDATGNATQLGRFTLDIPHLVDRPTRTAVGTYEFTAANGDTLIAAFTGIATPTAMPAWT